MAKMKATGFKPAYYDPLTIQIDDVPVENLPLTTSVTDAAGSPSETLNESLMQRVRSARKHQEDAREADRLQGAR